MSTKKKLLIQKLNQLRDSFKKGTALEEIEKDILDLKLSKDDKHFILLENKYRDLIH